MAKTKTDKAPAQFAEMLPKELRESISDESLKSLEEGFNTLVERRVDERVKLAVESALAQQDEEHDKDLQKLVVRMDECYAKKAADAFKMVMERHQTRVKRIKDNGYKALAKQKEKMLSEAKTYKEHLVEAMEAFLANKLEELMPQKQLAESVRNTAAVSTLKHIAKLVGVTPAAMSEQFKKGLLEAKEIFAEQKEIIESHTAKETELHERIESLETQKKLYEMTESLPDKEKNHLRKIFADKDRLFLENHFDGVLSLYRQAQKKETESLKRKTMEDARKRVPAASRKTILESVKMSRPSSRQEVSRDDALINAIISDAENEY